MVRAVLALTVASCFLSPGFAVSARRNVLPPAKAPALGAKEGGVLIVTKRTRVFLDGRPCRYEHVPDDAVITFAEVDSDAKTLLLIRFRSSR